MAMKEAVVFVHGIWVNGLEQSLLRHRVRQCGYDCHQFSYHSLLRSPRQNADRLQAFLQKIDADVVHFVVHSLGGVVLLHLFDRHPDQRPGRVIMLGTPINGSSLARKLYRFPPARLLLGRSVVRGLLGDMPRWKGTRPLAIIAGNRGIGFGLIVLNRLEEPNDGTVCLHETESTVVTHHLEVPYSHTQMLFVRPVAEAVCHYLDVGRF